MRRLLGFVRYRFNRLLSRGTGGHYLLLALFAGLIVVFGLSAGLVGLFSQGALQAEGIADDIDGGLLDSAWWSLKHVIDPGAFAEDYGVAMVDGKLAGLTARAVVVLDADGTVLHSEQVPEIAQEPDYDAALGALG